MDRQMMLKVLVPVGGLAVLVLIVGVVIAVANMDSRGPAAANPAGGTPPPPPTPNEAPKLTFALTGPEWQDVDPAKYPGLKFWEVSPGSGTPCPTIEQQPGVVPIMHYTGWLTDGTAFDSSRRSNQPLTLPLRQLVKGWQAAVPGMKPGGVRRLYVPSALGYGAVGQGKIPPNADLVFEMELLNVR